MRIVPTCALAVAIALLSPAVYGAPDQDADRVVEGGGISAPGWTGKTDSGRSGQGLTVAASKFVQQGDEFHLNIGPAAIYWNPANRAQGNYTVKATFTEPKQGYDHPHPFGLFIGGANLDDTDKQTFVYCVAYRNGTFLIRQFNGTTVTNVVARQPHAAVHQAAADAPVTQEIAWSVKDGRADCLINGTSVASLDRAQLVGPGKLASTDGIYGIRVSHNLDVVVRDLALTEG